MKTILFVCTGNTCRSPMAACMMNALFTKAGRSDLKAVSAGLAAFDGQPASPGAVHAMAKRGLSLAGHRSQSVSAALLAACDAVFCMSEHHAAALTGHFASLPPVYALSPAVADPFGGSDAEYEACAAQICKRLEALLPLLTGSQAR